MTYTHLTTEELVWIEEYHIIGKPVKEIAKKLSRSLQTIYNVIHYISKGNSIQDYYRRYQENKRRCGAKKKQLTGEQIQYIQSKVSTGWTPDVIIGRQEMGVWRKLCKFLYVNRRTTLSY